jgi:hypothetical protein
MAYGTGGGDMTGLIGLLGGTAAAALVVGVWAANSGGQGGPSTDRPSFQAVEAIPPGESRVCPNCQGKREAVCFVCGGRKKVFYNMLPYKYGEDWCQECSGTGISRCNLCKGTGKITSEQRPGKITGNQQPAALKWGGKTKP